VSRPFFTIVITTYDRALIVRRCIDSCLSQSFADFELVVVDDGSTDGTAAMLESYDDPRLRVVAHDSNRGINPSRYTGVTNARGEWIVVVDSDDELAPGALVRLREIIAGLPPGVRVVRSRLRHDDGRITPAFVPAEPYGYEGRIRWAEAEGGNDAGRCLHRDVFEASPYIHDRRGAMETLFELNLAQSETSVCVEDVLGLVHSDAPDSWLRSNGASDLIPRLRREAPDMLWMAETTLSRHGPALARIGPRQHQTLLRNASMQAFLLGRRRQGASYALRALRGRKLDLQTWATLLLGLIGPGCAARGALAYRRLGDNSGRRMPPRSASASTA
jgi:glycosyltransferase involved in cell wall biosynthesis